MMPGSAEKKYRESKKKKKEEKLIFLQRRARNFPAAHPVVFFSIRVFRTKKSVWKIIVRYDQSSSWPERQRYTYVRSLSVSPFFVRSVRLSGWRRHEHNKCWFRLRNYCPCNSRRFYPATITSTRVRVHASASASCTSVEKTYFYLNYRWESNIFDIINLCRLEWTRTGATFSLFLFLPIQLLLFLLCFFIFTPSKPSSFFLSSFCFLILLTHVITITRVPLVCVHFHDETSNLGRVMKKLSKREKGRETRIGDGGCTKSYISA